MPSLTYVNVSVKLFNIGMNGTFSPTVEIIRVNVCSAAPWSKVFSLDYTMNFTFSKTQRNGNILLRYNIYWHIYILFSIAYTFL